MNEQAAFSILDSVNKFFKYAKLSELRKQTDPSLWYP